MIPCNTIHPHTPRPAKMHFVGESISCRLASRRDTSHEGDAQTATDSGPANRECRRMLCSRGKEVSKAASSCLACTGSITSSKCCILRLGQSTTSQDRERRQTLGPTLHRHQNENGGQSRSYMGFGGFGSSFEPLVYPQAESHPQVSIFLLPPHRWE